VITEALDNSYVVSNAPLTTFTPFSSEQFTIQENTLQEIRISDNCAVLPPTAVENTSLKWGATKNFCAAAQWSLTGWAEVTTDSNYEWVITTNNSGSGIGTNTGLYTAASPPLTAPATDTVTMRHTTEPVSDTTGVTVEDFTLVISDTSGGGALASDTTNTSTGPIRYYATITWTGGLGTEDVRDQSEWSFVAANSNPGASLNNTSPNKGDYTSGSTGGVTDTIEAYYLDNTAGHNDTLDITVNAPPSTPVLSGGKFDNTASVNTNWPQTVVTQDAAAGSGYGWDSSTATADGTGSIYTWMTGDGNNDDIDIDYIQTLSTPIPSGKTVTVGMKYQRNETGNADWCRVFIELYNGPLLVQTYTVVDAAAPDATWQTWTDTTYTTDQTIDSVRIVHTIRVDNGDIMGVRTDEVYITYDTLPQFAPPRQTGDTTGIACNTCHQFGPDDETAGYKDSFQYYYDQAGSHAKHNVSLIAGTDPVNADALNTCTICHLATTNIFGSDHADGTVDLRSGSIGTRTAGPPRSDTGTYTPATRECRNNYCHGSIWTEPDEPVLTQIFPRWGNPSTVDDCGDCHMDQGAAASVGYYYSYTEIHHPHSLSGSIKIACEVCHARNASSSPNTTHAGGDDNIASERTVEVRFTDNPANVSYGGTQYFSKDMWTNPYTGSGVSPSYAEGSYTANDNDFHNKKISWTQGTCTNVWCHSNANPVGGTNAYRSAAWNQQSCYFCHNDPISDVPNLAICARCHGRASAAASMAAPDNLSSTHIRHVATDRYAFGCNQCHAATVTGTVDNTINNHANHVNGAKNIQFSTVRATTIDQSGGGWVGGTRTCSAIYCHSPGIDNDAAGGFAGAVLVTWTDTLSCTSCHNSDVASGTPMATNAHGKHLTNNILCAACHNATADNTSNTALNATTGYALHVNGTRDVVLDNTYDNTPANKTDDWTAGTSTCSNVKCHGNNPIVWTSTITSCDSCHSSTSADADDFTFSGFTGTVSNINSTEWTNTGHGGGELKLHEQQRDDSDGGLPHLLRGSRQREQLLPAGLERDGGQRLVADLLPHLPFGDLSAGALRGGDGVLGHEQLGFERRRAGVCVRGVSRPARGRGGEQPGLHGPHEGVGGGDHLGSDPGDDGAGDRAGCGEHDVRPVGDAGGRGLRDRRRGGEQDVPGLPPGECLLDADERRPDDAPERNSGALHRLPQPQGGLWRVLYLVSRRRSFRGGLRELVAGQPGPKRHPLAEPERRGHSPHPACHPDRGGGKRHANADHGAEERHLRLVPPYWAAHRRPSGGAGRSHGRHHLRVQEHRRCGQPPN
jgi:predicted CxxxxCH...CXXCH cytochrome family protein